MSGFHVVIPARYASTRLPGKPLLPLAGKPMVQHVYERALESEAKHVVIATDDEGIQGAAEVFGAEVCMTAAEHQSGTDRIAEVAGIMGWHDDEIVVNLQGDEPLMPPGLLNQVAHALISHPEASMSTLAVPIDDPEQVFDTHAVKVVTDRNGLALYFSRAPIPWKRDRFAAFGAPQQPSDDFTEGVLRHLGIYAYRVGFLKRYIHWQSAPIERHEALEQLRVLWQGERIAVDIAIETPPTGVDTQDDYQRLVEILEQRLANASQADDLQ